MASFKVTKKHHKHINNPFPPNPTTLPSIQGALISNPQTLPYNQTYEIGDQFYLNWSPANGGSVSISHTSNPSRSILSTLPGRAFVSAAAVDTEVEESRGSFAIKDGSIHLLCNHQTIEDIRVIRESDQSPAVLIRGRIFSVKGRKRGLLTSEVVQKKVSTYAKYWVLFDQKTRSQVGFQVRLGKLNEENVHKLSPRRYTYKGFTWKFVQIRRFRIGWRGYFSRKRVPITVSPAHEQNVAMKNAAPPDFNRISITYSSERDERFYGFGEQFSYMDFKGKRVPILVQEQGIGRGDQPHVLILNAGLGEMTARLMLLRRFT